MSIFNKIGKFAFNMIFDNSENHNEKEQEPCFGGVPLSELDKIAKECYHGKGVSIDQYGFLEFRYTSTSNKKLFRTQMYIDDNGMIAKCIPNDYYPGQWSNSGDTFVRIANERFVFTK